MSASQNNQSARPTLLAYGATDVGRKRKNNEDAFYVPDAIQQRNNRITEAMRRAGYLFIVADGVGGEQYGEVASALAIEGITELYHRQLQRAPGEVRARELVEILQEVNYRVFQEAEARRAATHMGTTSVVLSVQSYLNSNSSHTISYSWLGDSRLYLVPLSKRERIKQLTWDHTIVEEELRRNRGNVDLDNLPNKNVLSRSLGGDIEARPSLGTNELRDGDSLVLCSDGLTNHVKDAVIERTVRKHRDPRRAAKELIQLALDGGGSDNVTVIVIILGYPNPQTGQLTQSNGTAAKSTQEAPQLVDEFAATPGADYPLSQAGKAELAARKQQTQQSVLLLVGAVFAVLAIVFLVLIGSTGGGDPSTPPVASQNTEVPIPSIASADSATKPPEPTQPPTSAPAANPDPMATNTPPPPSATITQTPPPVDQFATREALQTLVATQQSGALDGATSTAQANATAMQVTEQGFQMTLTARVATPVENPIDPATVRVGQRYVTRGSTPYYFGAGAAAPSGSVADGRTVVISRTRAFPNQFIVNFDGVVWVHISESSGVLGWVRLNDLRAPDASG